MPATSGYPHHEGRGYSLPRPFFLPLFTGVRGIGILRTSQVRSSRKFTIAAVRYPGAYLAEIGFLGYYSCFLIIHIGERTVAASVGAR